MPVGVDPELRQFLLTTSDQAALLERAAALRAEGRAGATSTVLQRLLQLYPGQPNALYALGQVHAALKDWPLSEQYYMQAAKSPQVLQLLLLLGSARGCVNRWHKTACADHLCPSSSPRLALQLDAQSRARSWFGSAVALHMQGEDDTAIDAFQKAADAAQTGARAWCLLACVPAGVDSIPLSSPRCPFPAPHLLHAPARRRAARALLGVAGHAAPQAGRQRRRSAPAATGGES